MKEWLDESLLEESECYRRLNDEARSVLNLMESCRQISAQRSEPAEPACMCCQIETE